MLNDSYVSLWRLAPSGLEFAHELGRIDPKGRREPNDVHKTHIPLASLDGADI